MWPHLLMNCSVVPTIAHFLSAMIEQLSRFRQVKGLSSDPSVTLS
jgi:hypothetical protein